MVLRDLGSYGNITCRSINYYLGVIKVIIIGPGCAENKADQNKTKNVPDQLRAGESMAMAMAMQCGLTKYLQAVSNGR